MKIPFNLGSARSRFSYGDRLRPARDWSYMLVLVLVLALASVAWNAWLFRSVSQEDVLEETVAGEAFDATPVEEARAVFERRAEEERKYRLEYRFVDPSR